MIPYGKHHIDESDIDAVVTALRSGVLTQGPAVELFEQEVAAYVGARFAVAVSSGTAALHLAALAAGVGKNCSLITSPITFVASANAALYAGGRVAFADIEANTINLSSTALALALETNLDTRAVMPVHFGGLPCNMSAIKLLADKAGAVVIEDAAHALGAKYDDGGRVGCCSHSLMTIFSFHPVKAIAAGEGGMITTNDEVVYRKLLRYRSHGINKLDDPYMLPDQAYTGGAPNPWYYEMQELGFHYRITDLQCALALSQFRKLDQFIARRAELANRYDVALAEFRHCRPAQTIGRDLSGHHLYAVRIEYGTVGLSRLRLMSELRQRGIVTQVHYIPVPAQPYYRQLGHTPEPYVNAQAYYEDALTLPLFYGLSNDQQDTVVEALRELVG